MVGYEPGPSANLLMDALHLSGWDRPQLLESADRVLQFEYRGAPQTVGVMRRAALESQGHLSVRKLAEEICQGVASKDYASEYLAIYYFILGNCRYMRDPRTVELVKAPHIVATDILAGKTPSLDCLPADTLLLKKGYQLASISEIRAGDQIWGYDRWSTVQGVVYKGILPVDSVRMNNGSTFSATPDHLVYVDECPKHPNQELQSKICTCEELVRTRIRVGDLKPRMLLAQPPRLPFGDVEMDPDKALVEGLYISDGWHQNTSFAISGQDGCPKEEQKRVVQEICNRLGIKTTWYRKALHVYDSEWVLRMHQMGGRAPEKHALDINLGEGPAANLLRGIMADSGQNTNGSGRTFTTTSYRLLLQTRLLHKMFGISCGERFISNHGGLGQNPIWRLQTRAPREDGARNKRLRVKAVERQVVEVPVYDIQTDDHYVYLPHADVTVSNCDDLAALSAALVLTVGGKTELVTVAFKNMFYNGERQYSHVFCRAQEPRNMTWVVLDPVSAEKTGEMISRIRAAKVWAVA